MIFHGVFFLCFSCYINALTIFNTMNALNNTRSEDEEIVAIVENNACGVDALQGRYYKKTGTRKNSQDCKMRYLL